VWHSDGNEVNDIFDDRTTQSAMKLFRSAGVAAAYLPDIRHATKHGPQHGAHSKPYFFAALINDALGFFWPPVLPPSVLNNGGQFAGKLLEGA